MSDFVHLHNHSDYSLLDGAVTIEKMVEHAAKLGMKHLALTDHGNLFGVIHFENACRKYGINPVFGCEVYVAPESRTFKPTSGPRNYHLVLYCKNVTGYKNLIQLVSKANTEGFYYKPRIDDELLEQYHEGLIASSACLAGEIARLLIRNNDYEAAKTKALYYRDLFGPGNYFLELMNHGIPDEKIMVEGIARISKETGIPMIATNDIHYLLKEHASVHDILLCTQTGKELSDPNRMRMTEEEFYFKTPEEMKALFPQYPEAITNTVKLAEMCDVTIPKPGPILPIYEIPEEFKDEDAYIKHLTWKGIEERYETITDEIKERTKFELDTLIGMGFVGYFLIVADFVNWAKDHDIPVGPGRGSGAGSIIAYAMKITDVEPLQYDLLFERFLNPDRVSMPDFDIDFCPEGREDVINYVRQKYGEENVASICTFGTFKAKAALKDVARVIGIPFDESNAISKLVPDEPKITIAKALNDVPELKKYRDQGPLYKKLFDSAMVLEGMNRHVSTHACGIVIGRSAITDFVPLHRDQKKDTNSTQFTMDIIEERGLVKMDFLGLQTLTILKNTQKMIRKHHPDFDLDKVGYDDIDTYKLLSRGESEAIFQFESEGMQATLKQAKPDSLEDLTALNALYRPGPMDNIPQFINSKHGKQKIVFPDDSLAEVLTPTYGVIVYQEQVMKVAQIIGGFSLGKADIMRRVMGKKKEKDMAPLKVEFVQGALKRGYSEKKATDIFELLEPFAGYGFNKSHALAYSIIAYKTAYCKTHFPAEFMAANLTNEINNTDKMKSYITVTKKMGIDILPPDINLSDTEFTVVEGKIYYGLTGLKGLGGGAADEIIRERESKGSYKSFIDFLERVNLRAVNKKPVEALILAGLFDKIETRNRQTLLYNLGEILPIIQKGKEAFSNGQVSLFDNADEDLKQEISFTEVEPLPFIERLKQEKSLLGFYVSGHPLDPYKEIYEEVGPMELTHLGSTTPGQSFNVIGLLTKVETRTTKQNKQMAIINVEDFSGSFEFTLFPRDYNKFAHLLTENRAVGIRVKVTENHDCTRVYRNIEGMKPVEEMTPGRRSSIHIEIKTNAFDKEKLVELKESLNLYPGRSKLFLHLIDSRSSTGAKTIIRSSTNGISDEKKVIDQLNENPIVASVWKE